MTIGSVNKHWVKTYLKPKRVANEALKGLEVKVIDTLQIAAMRAEMNNRKTVLAQDI